MIYFVILSVLFTCHPDEAAGEETVSLTLNKAIELGLARDQRAVERMEVAKLAVKAAKRNFFPQLKIGLKDEQISGGFFEEEQHKIAELDFIQPLYAGGRLKASLKLAETKLSLARNEYESLRRETISRIKEAYLKLAMTQEEVRLTEDIYQEALNELEVVRKKFKFNLVHQIDVLKAKQAVNEAGYRLLQARNERNLANMKLVGKLFDQPGFSIEIADTFSYTPFSGEVEELIQLAEERNLSYLKSRLAILQDEYNLVLLKGQTKPGLDVKLGGYLDHTEEETDKSWEIELRFDLFSPTAKISALSERKRDEYYSLVTSHGIEASLFDNPSIWAEIKEAEAAIKESARRSKQIKDRIAQEIRERCFRLKETENLLEVTEEGIQIAGEELKIVRVKQKMKRATSAEVLKAKLALNKSRIRRNRLVYEYQLTLVELEELVGIEFPHIKREASAIFFEEVSQ